MISFQSQTRLRSLLPSMPGIPLFAGKIQGQGAEAYPLQCKYLIINRLQHPFYLMKPAFMNGQ